MNVFLRETLDCTPDAAWAAIAKPEVFREISSPLMRISSKKPSAFPEVWTGDAPHTVSLYLFGIIPLGTQIIDVHFSERPGGVRMMIDSGKPLSGPMTVLKHWDHRMAVSAAPGNKTLLRDRLVVKAGIFTPFVWLGMSIFWQFRARKIMRAAKKWD